MRSDFIGHQSRTALNRPSAEQCGLTTRPGAQIEPALVPPLDGSIGEHESDQLTALILDPGARLPHRTDPTGVSPGQNDGTRTQIPGSRLSASGGLRLLREAFGAGHPGAGAQHDLGLSIVGLEQWAQFVLGTVVGEQRLAHGLDHPYRVGLDGGQRRRRIGSLSPKYGQPAIEVAF